MLANSARRSVTKIKLDGAVRTHRSEQVSTSPEGTWLFAPEGTAVHYDTGELYTHHNTASVQLLIPGEWWTAWWWQQRRGIAERVAAELRERLLRDRAFIEHGFTVLDHCLAPAAGSQSAD